MREQSSIWEAVRSICCCSEAGTPGAGDGGRGGGVRTTSPVRGRRVHDRELAARAGDGGIRVGAGGGGGVRARAGGGRVVRAGGGGDRGVRASSRA